MGRKPTVIKAGTADAVEGHGGLRQFDLNDVTREAQRMVAEARAEAARIVDEARAEAVVIREAAREEAKRAGREEGLREGRDTGRAEAFEAARREFTEQQKKLIDSCQQTITSINTERASWSASARQDLIDLAVAIARRVVGRVGQCDRDAVLKNLEEAIKLAGERSDVTIRVNPVDAETARQFADSLVNMQKQWDHIRIVEEPDVSPGGCRVQWGTGAVDARLETQLDRIEAELSAGSKAGTDRSSGAADS